MLTAYTSNKQDTRQARLRRFVRHSQLKRYSEVSTYDHLNGIDLTAGELKSTLDAANSQKLDYHDRDFEGLSDNMKEKAMLKTLIHTLLRHSFGVVQAPRTSSNLHETHQHRDSKVCWVLLHSFGVVQAQRTYPNHTITELKVCRVLLH